MDQSGQVQPCKHSKRAARRVSIVGYNTGKNQSDCTNSLKCLRISFIGYRTVYPTDGLIIERLDSRKAIWWFVDGEDIDDLPCVYNSWAIDLLLSCGGNILYAKQRYSFFSHLFYLSEIHCQHGYPHFNQEQLGTRNNCRHSCHPSNVMGFAAMFVCGAHWLCRRYGDSQTWLP